MRTQAALSGIAISEVATRRLHHRGYWRLVRALGTYCDEEVVVNLEQGSVAVSLHDPYWARITAAGFRYEPEVECLLRGLRTLEFNFLDVGANIGYWSILVSGMFPERQVIAVEPNPAIFAGLCRNANLNADRFTCIQAAVTPSPVDAVDLFVSSGRGEHAAASADGGRFASHQARVTVPATTLDELVDSLRRDGTPLLVKLDIEGLETAVLAKSEASRDPGVCFVYEDHGCDPGSPTTGWLLEHALHDVFFLPHSGRPRQIDSLSQLRRYKKSPKVGYNLVALPKTGPWPTHLGHRTADSGHD